MVDFIADYLENIRSRRVFPNVSPGYMRTLVPDSAPEDPEPWQNIFNDIETVVMPGVSTKHRCKNVLTTFLRFFIFSTFYTLEQLKHYVICVPWIVDLCYHSFRSVFAILGVFALIKLHVAYNIRVSVRRWPHCHIRYCFINDLSTGPNLQTTLFNTTCVTLLCCFMQCSRYRNCFLL